MGNGTSRREEFSSGEICKVVARYRRSGLSVLQFAQEQGIPPGRLHYWIYQKGRTRRSKRLGAWASKPVFHELKVASMLPGIDSWGAEVSLPGGVAVRFSQKAAAEWIGWVVQALRRPC